MRVAELCAGYGGLTLALKLAGAPVELVWYAETDEAASKVIATHHPDVPNVGNITPAQFSTQEPVDILLAGWPCQGQSTAGKRLGSADERWLWPDVFRAVRVLQPAVFFGENVPGLFTIEGGALFGGVLADLDEVGYTVRWTTVGACKVGFCHHRHRVFIHATRETTTLNRWPLARRFGAGWEVAEDTMFGVPGLLPQWPRAGVMSGGRAWSLPASECRYGGIVLLPTPMARDGMSGPGHAATAEGSPNLRTVVATLLPTPTATYWARNATARRAAPKPTTNTDSWTLADVAYADRWRIYRAAILRHELVVGRAAPDPAEPSAKGGVRLTARFSEWMQGLEDGYVTGHVGRTAALRLLGNGVVPLQGAYGWQLMTRASQEVTT